MGSITAVQSKRTWETAYFVQQWTYNDRVAGSRSAEKPTVVTRHTRGAMVKKLAPHAAQVPRAFSSLYNDGDTLSSLTPAILRHQSVPSHINRGRAEGRL